MQKITSGLTTLGKVSAGIAAGGLLALGAGFVKGAAAGLGFNNSMEQATAQINAFTKDSEQTAKILEMVRERAARTPFAFEDMARAAAALGPAAKSSGVPLEELIAQAEILAASNPAEGFEGAVFSLKEALGGDFLSIIERFNLPKQRLKELKDEGVPAIEAIRIAMAELGLDADLVSNMANTAAGRWSTLVDTFTTLASTVTAPIFEGVSKGMGDFQALLDANMPKLQEFAATLGERVGGMMTWLATTAIPTMVTAFSTIATAINDWVIVPAQNVAAAFSTWSAFGTEWGIVAALQEIGNTFPVLQPLTDWLAIHAPEALQKAREGFGFLRDQVAVFKDFIVNEALPRLTDLYNSLKTEAPAAWATFKQSIDEDVLPALRLVSEVLGKQGNEDLPKASNDWQTFGKNLETTLNTAMTKSQEWGTSVRTMFIEVTGYGNQLVVDFGVTMAAWVTIFQVKIAEVVAFFTALPGQITAAIGDVSTLLLQTGIDMVQGLINGLKSLNPGSILSGIVRGAVDAARAAIQSNSPSKLTRDQLGKPMGEGIVVGILATAPSIKQAIGKTMDDNFFWGSPFRDRAEKYGKAIGSAFRDGLSDELKNAQSLKQAMGKMMDDNFLWGSPFRDAAQKAGKVVAESFKIGVDRGLEDTKNLKQIFGGKLRAALEPEMDAVGEYLARVMIAGFNRVVADFQFGGQGDHIFVPGPGHVTPSAGKGDKTVQASSNTTYTIMVDARGSNLSERQIESAVNRALGARADARLRTT